MVSKTKEEGCGYRYVIRSFEMITDSCSAHYADGQLVPPKPGMSEEPRPAAANDGTVISVRRDPESATELIFAGGGPLLQYADAQASL